MGQAQLTIVSTSKGPDGTSIFRQSNGVGASTGNLTHVTDVLNKCGNVPTVTITMTYKVLTKTINDTNLQYTLKNVGNRHITVIIIVPNLPKSPSPHV